MEKIHPYYIEKDEHASEPGGFYDWLFWFVVIFGLACVIALIVAAIIQSKSPTM